MGVDLANGHSYNSDKGGLITVNDNADAKALKDAGYVQAGMVARTSKYWVCDNCARDCLINHCSRCESEDLRKVVA